MSSAKLGVAVYISPFFRQGDFEAKTLLRCFGALGCRVRRKIWKQKFHGMKHPNVAVWESKLINVILGFLEVKKMALTQILKLTSVVGTGVGSSGPNFFPGWLHQG